MNIFKWIINENKSIFLTEENGSGKPFIYDYNTNERTYPTGESVAGEVPDYIAIRGLVEEMSEEDYNSAFEEMLGLKNKDNDGKTCSFQPYSYYYDFDESLTGYDKFGILEYGCWCNIELLESDKSPVIDFNLQKTDKTRQYEIDFKLPRTYEGISFFLNPTIVNFLYENIETEKDNENVSIYLYCGNKRVVPDSVELVRTLISGDTSEDVITLSDDKSSFNIKPGKVDDFTSCKVDVTVTYNFKNGDTEETFTSTRTLYYNKVYLILSSYVAEGSASSEILMKPDEFKMLVERLEGQIQALYDQTYSSITFNANNAIDSLDATIRLIPEMIEVAITDEIGGLKNEYELTASGKKQYFENTINGYISMMIQDADGALRTMEDTKRGYLNTASESAEASDEEITAAIEGFEAQYHSGLDGFNTIVEDRNNQTATIFSQTYSGVTFAAYDAISGLSGSIALSAATVEAKVEDAEGNAASITIDLDGVRSQVRDIDGNISEIKNEVSGATSELTLRIQDDSGKIAGIKIAPNQITIVNDYNTFSGLTNINNNVIIEPDGTLRATDVEINGIVKRKVCVVEEEMLYYNNIGVTESVYGFDCFNDLSYLELAGNNRLSVQDEKGKRTFFAYPIQRKTIFRLPYQYKRQGRPGEYEGVCYEVLLPIDPEYIGTKIKILSADYTNANTGVDYSIEQTHVNIKCGCVSNFNLYAATEEYAASSSNTVAGVEVYLSTDDVVDNEYYYPYNKQYKCVDGKDAGRIGGAYDNQGQPLSEITFQTSAITPAMNQQKVPRVASLELMGVPSSTLAYNSKYVFETNCGIPTFENEDIKPIGTNKTIKPVYLTKWVITNLNGFEIPRD